MIAQATLVYIFKIFYYLIFTTLDTKLGLRDNMTKLAQSKRRGVREHQIRPDKKLAATIAPTTTTQANLAHLNERASKH
jgi:hypothetical protein